MGKRPSWRSAICWRVLLCVLLLPGLFPAEARPGKTPIVSEAFFEAENCAREVRRNAAKARQRAGWVACIEKFQAVYQQDLKGPFAPASLFHLGTLYADLHRRFGGEADLRAATEQFELLQKRFPASAYRPRAAAEMEKLKAEAAAGPAPRESAPATPAKTAAPRQAVQPPAPREKPPSPQAREQLSRAESCFKDLSGKKPTENTRREWMLCIGRFRNIYLNEPSGTLAPQALYQEGLLYRDLHRGLKFNSDLRAAKENFEKIKNEFPEHPVAAKAEKELQALPRPRPPAQAARRAPDPPAPSRPEPQPPPAPPETADAAPAVADFSEEGLAIVQDVKHWSNPDYTRVVVYVDRETDYSHRLLKRDPTIDKPPRLYVDLANATLAEGSQRTIPIHDDLLSDARAARYTPDSVRVVVDIKSFETYKVFSLRDPFRIVIDVWGKNGAPVEGAGGEPPAASVAPPADRSGKVPRGALARQLALGVRRIVIDPGHGGKDFGAPGFIPGVHEKDIVLQIARKTARKIREELNLEAILTRNEDRYLTLEERTAFANTQRADLFVSIHTNASRDPRAFGTETYFLNLATDDEAIRVAAMENATSTKNISDLHSILNELLRNAKINESSRLAEMVQASLVRNLGRNGYSRVKDKGVKQAPFYVLLGARMPAILVETAFISNREECRLLTTPAFQEHLAEAIVNGIRAYIREIQPTAFESPAGRPPG
ncbi:MAG: N-acetylmuramoyl-L-alanine amidase [Desulfobacterales bacterium]